MSDEELAAIKAACEAATEGPWYALAAKGGYNGDCAIVTASGLILYEAYETVGKHARGYVRADSEANAEFAAGARQWVPALVAEVERLNDELADAEEALRLLS